MSISSPQSTLDELQGQLERYVVLLGPEDGTPPALEHEVEYLELLKLSRTAGGARVEAIALRLSLAQLGRRIADTGAPVNYHRQVEVRRLDEDGEPTIIEAWGFLANLQTSITKTSEEMTLTARLDPFVFGKPLDSVPIFDVEAEEQRDVHWAYVFNPEIDRIVEQNRSKRREEFEDDEEGEATGPYYFVSPESVRTGAARITAQDNEIPTDWKLSEAVHRLCWSCNPDETHITNPTLEELQDAFGDHDDDLKNDACEQGAFLPELLDTLLRKYGFGWYLVHSLEEEESEEEEEEPTEKRVTKFQFYRRGEGVELELLMQRIGETINRQETNVDSYDHDVIIAELANKITVRGELKRYESTFPLIPGWKAEHETVDDLDAVPPSPGDPPVQKMRDIGTLALTNAFGKDNPVVGRQFVLNEAGDYCDPVRVGIEEPYRWEELPDTGNWAVVRRRFRPCISRHADGDDKRSYGYLLEWWDRNVEDAVAPSVLDDPGWTKCKGSWQILEHQCGVYFDEPQGYLWDLIWEDYNYRVNDVTPEGENSFTLGLHLRITASVDSDYRLERTADKQDSSPHGETIPLLIDMPDKFHFREVSEESALHGKPDPDEVDDGDRLQTYADQVRTIEDAADVSCSIPLTGVGHAEFEIGKILKKMNGRNLTLTAGNPSEGTGRALQIVGVTLHLATEQKTELLIETFRKEKPVLP